MTALSDGIQARLRALAETFASELPGRVRDVEESALRLLEAEATLAEVEDLRHHAHKLAGSAATFGFHHVTACAKRLEHAVDEILGDERTPNEDDRERIRALVSELGDAARARVSDEEIEDLEEVDLEEVGAEDARADAAVPARPEPLPEGAEPAGRHAAEPGIGDRNRRAVAIMIESRAVADSLADQFAFYGFDVTRISESAEVTPALSRGVHTALILDVTLIEDDPALANAIIEAHDVSHGKVHVVYVSERDDFSVRLKAVRTAGAAFFSLPVDTLRLVDTVDGLTSGGAGEPYHVLIVDDDIEQVSHHALVLQRAGMITSVVSDPNQIFSVLIESKPDLILMDMYMPGCTGPELATIIRQQEAFVGIPIVFLSVETDEDRQFQAVSQGGDGFLCKPIKPEHLIISVSQRIERTRNMRFFMERDSLTGLLNHTHLMQSLSTEVQRAERVDRPLCFAMIDLDHFKEVNDGYGHLTGDRILKSLSRLLGERLRKTDVVGRYGGEEFGIVMFNATLEDATRILDGIRDEFSRVVHEAGEIELSVTFSCGIAAYPDHDGPGPISEAADRALYLAKERGRNRIVSV